MGTKSRNQRENHAGHAATVLAVLSVLLLVFVACGIGFSEEPPETELLKEIIIEETVLTGQTVRVVLDFAQQYPARLDIKCDLLSQDDLATATPLPTATAPPGGLRRTPEPTLPAIPRVRPTPENKVLEIFETSLEPHEDGGPTGTATPALGSIERHFIAPEPGAYTVWCYTPVDQNNSLFQELTVLPR